MQLVPLGDFVAEEGRYLTARDKAPETKRRRGGGHLYVPQRGDYGSTWQLRIQGTCLRGPRATAAAHGGAAVGSAPNTMHFWAGSGKPIAVSVGEVIRDGHRCG
mgnify:CR=1 FL=1